MQMMASGDANDPSTYSGRVPVQLLKRFPFPACCVRSNIEFAINYKPERTDIILSWYPLTISSWILNCLWKLIKLTPLNPDTNVLENCLIPSIEFTGGQFLDRYTKPAVMRYNLPYWLIPKNRHAKYIYICRNPKDVLISCYFSILRQSSQPIMLEDFFREFIAGRVPYGNYFEHVLSWYLKRNQGNVLFISYENMHINPERTILDIARFLGPRHYESCLSHHIIESILYFRDFDYKRIIVRSDSSHQAFPELLRKHHKLKKLREKSLHEGDPRLLDTGYIGFGKDFLTREQSQIVDYKIDTEFKETELVNMRNL